MHLIDQVHLVSATGRCVLHVIQQLAGVFYLGAASRIHFNQIDKAAVSNFLTGRAHTAGPGTDALLTVQAARQNTGNGGLAHPAGPREKVGVVQTVLIQCMHQCPRDMLLPHQFIEGTGAVFPGKDLITHSTPAAFAATTTKELKFSRLC